MGPMNLHKRWPSLMFAVLLLSLGACASKGSKKASADLASLDQLPEESSFDQMDPLQNQSFEAPQVNYRKPASLSARGGMSQLQIRCGVYAAADEGSQKYSSLKEGRELWIKPAAEGWVEVQRKTGPAYMKSDCF